MPHEYKRHGTTTLVAALNGTEGSLISPCWPRHRHQEWLRNATHKHPPVQRWLTRHPRVPMPFTPTRSSWLNLGERVLGDLTANQIRRDVVRSVPELITAIETYVTPRNAPPTPGGWTQTAQEILTKVNRARRILDKTRTA